MPIRATKRGAARTPIAGDADVLICGASFAGLTLARELSGPARSGPRPRVVMVDRYEVGERQTSACAAPTEWLEHLGLGGSIQQTFGDLVIHARARTYRWNLPFTFSTFDYRTLCRTLLDGCDAVFETAKVDGRTGTTVHTDRGDLTAPLVVDALGWRRILGAGDNVQPPDARLSRGLEVHPQDTVPGHPDLELWLDPKYVRAGYSWSFPADGELRVGVGSFDPRDHVREPTERLASDVGVPAERWQGNWIPHQIRPAAEDGIFFVGDSAGHCLPTTAEGIRPAFHFALALGRELREVLAGRQTREDALAAYGAFSDAHRWKYEGLLRTQDAVGRINPRPRAMRGFLTALDQPWLVRWMFQQYLNICPPEAAARAAAAHGGYGALVAATAA
jgi:flavin-dependent dehydrogenase